MGNTVDASGPHFETAEEWGKWLESESERLHPILYRHRGILKAPNANTGEWDLDTICDSGFEEAFQQALNVSWDNLFRAYKWGRKLGTPHPPDNRRDGPGDMKEAATESLRVLTLYEGQLVEFLKGAEGKAAEVAFLGDGRFRCGGEVIQLIDADATVLETLISYGATSLSDLKKATNIESPNKVLKRIKERHPALDLVIILPGGKGLGGYRTTIKDESGG